MLYKLEDICTLITDGSHFSPEDEGIGYPMLSVKDMGDDDFDFGSCKHVGEAAYQKLVTNGCKPLVNDVVVAKDGSYLKTAFPITEDRDIALLSSIAILRPKISVVDPTYLSYYLKSKEVYRTVSLNYISGTALKRVILKGIKKIPIVLPDLHEQQFRADLLKKLNRIMRSRKQELQMLDDLIKARFVEMFGNPIINEKGFETKLGSDVFSLSNGKFVLESKRFEDGVPVYGGNGVSWYTDEILFENDTIVVGRVGFQSGNVHLVNGPLWISDNAMYISKLFDKGFDLRFLYFVMEHIDFTRFQDAGDLKKITQKPFMAMSYIKPPLSMQLDYIAFVAQVDKSKLQKKYRKDNNIKTIIQQNITRVNTALHK